MARIRKSRDFATTAQMEEPTIKRVQVYSARLQRRLYAQDIVKDARLRDHQAVAASLSTHFNVEFMDVCRRLIRPADIKGYDKGRVLPPGARSVHELLFNRDFTGLQAEACDQFADAYPDEYSQILVALYGFRQEEPSNAHQSSSAS